MGLKMLRSSDSRKQALTALSVRVRNAGNGSNEQDMELIEVLADKGFNDWRGREYDDFVPVEVTKTASYGDRTT